MKVRNVQFGERKNPDSSRVHGLRLAIRSLPVESIRESEGANGAELAPPLTPYDPGRSEIPYDGIQNEATGGKEAGINRLLTVEEVAVMLHVPVSWVYGRTRKRSSERLPGYRLGKYWRFREDEIHDWVEDQRGASRSA